MGRLTVYLPRCWAQWMVVVVMPLATAVVVATGHSAVAAAVLVIWVAVSTSTTQRWMRCQLAAMTSRKRVPGSVIWRHLAEQPLLVAELEEAERMTCTSCGIGVSLEHMV